MTEIKPGTKVKIKTIKDEIDGIMLESPDSSLYLIKLDSGYNIGIKKEEIVNIEEILETKQIKTKIKQINKNKNLPKIDMIITGGTISSRLDPKTGAVSWLTSPEDLFRFYPELLDVVNIRKIKIPFKKASENMDYLDWKEIAKQVQESLNNQQVKGVIITHGTDFLHYTSSALSFFLKDLNKPVVLTYSQRSSDRASSDARLNLLCSSYLAISDISEIMLVGHSSINDDFCYALKANKVRKLHTSKREAFKPVNTREIAKIFPNGKIEKILGTRKRDNKKKIKTDLKFNNNIALIKFYPGMKKEQIEFLSKKYEGLVIEVSGLGHLSTDESRNNLLPIIKKAINNGLIIVAVPQTIYGRLNPNVYSEGRKLQKTGIIFLEDMLPETAYVKLGYVLGHKNWKTYEKIKEKMLENISGEINKRLEQ